MVSKLPGKCFCPQFYMVAFYYVVSFDLPPSHGPHQSFCGGGRGFRGRKAGRGWGRRTCISRCQNCKTGGHTADRCHNRTLDNFSAYGDKSAVVVEPKDRHNTGQRQT
ncbi:unnamed protein product [Cuscuta europaea]|uniref:Uncharacterized protein n=1 Tax=Cuscuta europaea TaxID=41803 RepID=A0A9P0ZGK3_CUSEU|nr:unnamed protein product [Cuscuta europaea]